MSLDAEITQLTKPGTVTITQDGITVEGFKAENGSCRDVAVLACMWAIGELTRECVKTIERPGGGKVGID